MEITIKGNPKEIADLVSSIQNRQLEIESPLNLMSEALSQPFVILAKNSQLRFNSVLLNKDPFFTRDSNRF